MSAPPRGPRGGRGRGPRDRGGSRGRGGASGSSRPQTNDGNESDSGGKPAQRGRGARGASQGLGRGFSHALSQATGQQNGSRGGKISKGGSRASTPTPAPKAATATASALKSSSGTGEFPPVTTAVPGEDMQKRFERLTKERETMSSLGAASDFSGSTTLGMLKATSIVGHCQDKCSEWERAKRIYQRELFPQEKVRIG